MQETVQIEDFEQSIVSVNGDQYDFMFNIEADVKSCELEAGVVRLGDVRAEMTQVLVLPAGKPQRRWTEYPPEPCPDWVLTMFGPAFASALLEAYQEAQKGGCDEGDSD